MELLQRRIVLFSCFALFSGLTEAQNVLQSNQRQQVAVSNDAYSSSQASPAPQLMNTLLTVAAANGVLPDVLPALRPDQRQNYNVLPTSAVNNGPTFVSSPTIQPQKNQNFQNSPVRRLNSNQANGPARVNQQAPIHKYVNQQQGPVAKLNPLVIDKNFGIPMNLEVTLPQISLGVEVPDVELPPPPPPTPPPAPMQPIPTPTFVPISAGPIGDVGGRSRFKSLLPIIFLSLLNNGRCGSCGGNGNGGGGCGGCGGGCSSCNAVPVPYPIPIPIISPIVVRCDSSSSEEDSEEAET